ncbi:hypothetical protein [Austwickia chelonae]|uniref:hypothetical protein n=1 Tax=Austwickia chelonae TaxID=100225 RepID=UPI000E22EE21|nr:hypothetical protein [Austwickia chelonae]
MATWDDITAAVGLSLNGNRDRDRPALKECWDQTVESDHAQRCVIAHYLADLEPDLDAEVAWDEQALANHAHVADTDLAAVGIAHARGMAPSLHLNLGDGYLRQGRLEDARTQLEQGLAHQDALGDDGYGALIRKGLQGLSARLDAASKAANG